LKKLNKKNVEGTKMINKVGYWFGTMVVSTIGTIMYWADFVPRLIFIGGIAVSVICMAMTK
jgi:hypothetical protein